MMEIIHQCNKLHNFKLRLALEITVGIQTVTSHLGNSSSSFKSTLVPILKEAMPDKPSFQDGKSSKTILKGTFVS